MTKLAQLECSEYTSNQQALNHDAISKLHAQVNQWQVTKPTQSQPVTLQKTFKFDDYPSAVRFTNQVAQLAEQQNHHPKMVLAYGEVTVIWWTHVLNALHHNDFICAAKCEEISNNILKRAIKTLFSLY